MRYILLTFCFLLSFNFLPDVDWGMSTKAQTEIVYFDPITFEDEANEATLDFIAAVEEQLNLYNRQSELYTHLTQTGE